jgi:hypothetical protein
LAVAVEGLWKVLYVPPDKPARAEENNTTANNQGSAKVSTKQ